MGVLNAAQGVLNTAGVVANAVNGMTPKQFYSVADFYNFIKKPDNVPTNHPLFTVVPHMSNTADSKGNIYPIMRTMFTDEWLAKFAISIQSISLPSLTLSSGSKYGEAVVDETPQGWFQSMANVSPTYASKKEITIKFLDTQDPVIEKFIYPWFIYCMRTNDKKYDKDELEEVLNKHYSVNSMIKDTLKQGAIGVINWATQGVSAPDKVKQAGESAINALKKQKQILLQESPHTFPRMDIVIKFYRTDEVMGISELMNPNFVYKIYGAYPVEITLADPMSGKGTGASDIQRPVQFAYNHIVCLPDAGWESDYFGTSHFPFKGLSPAKLLSQAQNITATVAGQAESLSRAFK